MNPYRMAPPPQRWEPKLNPTVVRMCRPFRARMGFGEHGLSDVRVCGVEHVSGALAQGAGVLITPNHPSHADPFAMYNASDQIGSPFHFMATWHVFLKRKRWAQWMLQRHGVFSVDREGTDVRAFKLAVEILQKAEQPLVIFPEGEIYHCNDRVTPFREGPATIALAACRRAERSIVCIPAAVKYEYIDDPVPRLSEIMSQLERQIHWRPRTDRTLPERIYSFAEAMMSLKELEFLGKSVDGPLPERVRSLVVEIVSRVEDRHHADHIDDTIPKRIKELRRRILAEFAQLDATSARAEQLNHDLDDLFLAVQLFSYPGEYVAEDPSPERLAETLDKFEEDVLHLPSATLKGRRRATIYLDEPYEVHAEKKSRHATAELTDYLETRVQTMLDQHRAAKAGGTAP